MKSVSHKDDAFTPQKLDAISRWVILHELTTMAGSGKGKGKAKAQIWDVLRELVEGNGWQEQSEADIRDVPSLNLPPELIRVLESSIHTRLRTIADFWACGDEGEGRDDATGDAVIKDVKEMQERIEEGKSEKERLWREILEIAERTSKSSEGALIESIQVLPAVASYLSEDTTSKHRLGLSTWHATTAKLDLLRTKAQTSLYGINEDSHARPKVVVAGLPPAYQKAQESIADDREKLQREIRELEIRLGKYERQLGGGNKGTESAFGKVVRDWEELRAEEETCRKDLARLGIE